MLARFLESVFSVRCSTRPQLAISGEAFTSASKSAKLSSLNTTSLHLPEEKFPFCSAFSAAFKLSVVKRSSLENGVTVSEVVWLVSPFSDKTPASNVFFSLDLLITFPLSTSRFSTSYSMLASLSVTFLNVSTCSLIGAQHSLIWLNSKVVMSQQEILPAVSPANIMTSGLSPLRQSITWLTVRTQRLRHWDWARRKNLFCCS